MLLKDRLGCYCRHLLSQKNICDASKMYRTGQIYSSLYGRRSSDRTSSCAEEVGDWGHLMVAVASDSSNATLSSWNNMRCDG